MNGIQEELALFDPPSFESFLSGARATRLSIEPSKRLKSGWYVKYLPGGHRRELVIPAALAGAPAEIKEALVEWALLPRHRRASPAVKQRKYELERLVWRHYQTLGQPARKRKREDPSQWAGKTGGCRYDLLEVFTDLNKRHFNNELSAFLRWGSYASVTSYQSRKIDLQDQPYNMITIAGVYDHPDVPRFAIESILYHEMLHIAIPPCKANGRNVIHGPAFRKAEQAFPHYRRWRDWERNEAPRLRRSLLKRSKQKRRRR